MNIQLFKKGFLLFLLLIVCNISRAETSFSGLYAFGDSLMDTGNDYVLTGVTGFSIPPKTRYYQSRFSNGPNTVDQLWELMNHSTQVIPFMTIRPSELKITENEALNFSFGGSTSGIFSSVLGQFNVPGLLGQVGIFKIIKLGDGVLKKSVALIWTGANDYFYQYIGGVPMSADQVTKNIEKAVKLLYASGIRNFIVPNVPDLGDVPLALILASAPGKEWIPQALSQQTEDHNIKLDRILHNLAITLPQVKIFPVDIYSRVKSLITPSQIVPGPAAGCIYHMPVPNAEVCSAVNFDLGVGLYYWDEIHPTTEAHSILANIIHEVMTQ
ncbi:MAG: SGNH/GDSL hydrolase family protein [Methylobacter sp.]|nr:SGNH/GDSL hydrolase family protein [Methylobacter sp.]